jgi:exonuclease I
MRALIYDTETGGLDPEVHSVFSVGALVGDLDTGEVLEQFELLHKLPSLDDYNYTDKAIEVHGITPTEAFTQGVDTEEIQERFVDLWNNHGAEVIGGHNEPYDRRMMSFGIFKCTLPEFEANFTYRSVDSSPCRS